MKKLFAIQILFIIIEQTVQQVCSSDQQQYNYKCISKSCYERNSNSVFEVALTSPAANAYAGKVYCSATVQGGPNAISYLNSIRFGDSKGNGLYDAAANCLTYQVYSLVSDTNTQRRFTNTDGTPSWPARPSYSYNDARGCGELNFVVTQAELDTKSCVKTTTVSNNMVWNCYFELATTLSGIVQSQLFFSFRVVVNGQLTQQSGGVVNIVQTVVKKPCQAGDITCELVVAVDSGLSFCTDSTCTTLATTPQNYRLGTTVYMIHFIRDGVFNGVLPPVGGTGFVKNPDIVNNLVYQITNPTLTVSGTGSTLTFTPPDASMDIVFQGAGYNIYSLKVGVVQPNVTIYATGVLAQFAKPARILKTNTEGDTGFLAFLEQKNVRSLEVEQQKQFIVQSEAPLGNIVDDQSEAPLGNIVEDVIKDSSSSSSVSDDPTSSSSSSVSGASSILLTFAASLTMCLVLN